MLASSLFWGRHGEIADEELLIPLQMWVEEVVVAPEASPAPVVAEPPPRERAPRPPAPPKPRPKPVPTTEPVPAAKPPPTAPSPTPATEPSALPKIARVEPAAKQYDGIFAEEQLDQRPRAKKPLRPRYPRRMQAQGKEGTVVLTALIDRRGAVQKIEVEESAGDAFDEAARKALARLDFEPALVDGRRVASRVRFRVRFALR